MPGSNGWHYSWYYTDNVVDEMAIATFFDKERQANHICGASGCKSCALMTGPNGEPGPGPNHAEAHMQGTVEIKCLTFNNSFH